MSGLAIITVIIIIIITILCFGFFFSVELWLGTTRFIRSQTLSPAALDSNPRVKADFGQINVLLAKP